MVSSRFCRLIRRNQLFQTRRLLLPLSLLLLPIVCFLQSIPTTSPFLLPFSMIWVFCCFWIEFDSFGDRSCLPIDLLLLYFCLYQFLWRFWPPVVHCSLWAFLYARNSSLFIIIYILFYLSKIFFLKLFLWFCTFIPFNALSLLLIINFFMFNFVKQSIKKFLKS